MRLVEPDVVGRRKDDGLGGVVGMGRGTASWIVVNGEETRYDGLGRGSGGGDEIRRVGPG